MNRSLKDAKLRAVTALPAAAANNSSASIDLGPKPYPTIETIQARIGIPATTTLVDDKDITFKIQDSADNSTFADVAALAPFIVGGKTGNGSDAAERVVSLPPSVRRYVRVNAAVEASGGNNTPTSYTFELVF